MLSPEGTCWEELKSDRKDLKTDPGLIQRGDTSRHQQLQSCSTTWQSR